jgi:branched-chain amino acid aminotransferase
VREVDDHPIGSGQPGEITRAVQSAFEDALHGRAERYRDWLEPVPAELYEVAETSDLVA